MNLVALRTEVLNHGFDPIAFSTRINQYINDAQNLIARRVDYYGEEAVYDFNTVAGQTTYPWPPSLARIRSLRDTSRQIEMQSVGLRDIDRSATTSGAPAFVALTGMNLLLYPTPDNIYPMELRYWSLPPTLVADGDTPVIPADWHHLLWVYAVWLCYEAEDDAQMGQYWQQRFNAELSEFTADAKFPSTDAPVQARGMWDSDPSLTPLGWTLYGEF